MMMPIDIIGLIITHADDKSKIRLVFSCKAYLIRYPVIMMDNYYSLRYIIKTIRKPTNFIKITFNKCSLGMLQLADLTNQNANEQIDSKKIEAIFKELNPIIYLTHLQL